MNPKFYVIPGGKVRARVAAATFLAAERGAGHQPADGDQGSKTGPIVAESRIPLIERFDGSLQQGGLAPKPH